MTEISGRDAGVRQASMSKPHARVTNQEVSLKLDKRLELTMDGAIHPRLGFLVDQRSMGIVDRFTAAMKLLDEAAVLAI
jgi:hypothetical protein